MEDQEKDKLLDHEYDGIQELDNSLPSWWLNGFYFTIAFGIVYMLLYHVLDWAPLPEQEYRSEMIKAYAKNNPEEYMAKIAGSSFKRTKKEKVFKLRTAAADIERGRKLFMDPKQLCFTCHGNEGQGLVGPNLTDEYWLHGCSVTEIAKNIIKGFPSKGMMPYGSNQRLTDDDVEKLTAYIVSIKGSNPANPKAVDMERAKKCEHE